LAIEAGRYANIERQDRLGMQCTTGVIEDGYHGRLVGPNYGQLKSKLVQS